MNRLPAAIRKAAVLISALDDRTADALLEQMDSETAARVRNAVMRIARRPRRRAAMRCWPSSSRGKTPALAAGGDAGVELADSLAEQLDEPPLAGEHTAPAYRPLEFLRQVPPQETSRVLAREHRQTIAVVIAQLDADLAAQVLEQLPAELATDVLERLAWLDRARAGSAGRYRAAIAGRAVAVRDASRAPRAFAGRRAGARRGAGPVRSRADSRWPRHAKRQPGQAARLRAAGKRAG